MKRIALTVSVILATLAGIAQQSATQPATDSFYQLTPVEVRAVRAGEKAPFTKTNLGKAAIQQTNLGQDIPFLLNQTPSAVVNSDAGTGIGYTGLRIRGTDATRINFTLNGIPYNDAESQGTFLVNLPDFASSVNSIQVQRGVGTSSNGTGAFGATVSLSTNETNLKPYAELNNSFGSFNTWKNTVKAGTGLIDDRFTVDARLSRISSDGYIERATSDLQAFYLSGAYIGNKSTVRLNVFSGKEKTYQAWNGIPDFILPSNRRYNSSGREKSGIPYDNETDNYRQTHYQLFFTRRFDDHWTMNTAAFLTRGLGYYENYKADQRFADYGLPDYAFRDTFIKTTDLIRQKWLDNYFYGQVASLHYKNGKHQLTTGGGWTVYDGRHHGDVIWADYGIEKGYRYYDLDALKTDINVYAKWQYEISPALSLFTDLQYRHVRHRMDGFADNPSLIIVRKFDFINPKGGILFSRNGWQSYASVAVANKEPNRDDFEAGMTNQPKKESLTDFEAAVEKRTDRFQAGATLYYMRYKDQLVLTGMINDVGAYTRINVPKSYRAGIELQGSYRFTEWLGMSANLSLSRNKVNAFTEFLDDYDANFEWIGQVPIDHRNTDIAFSPAIVSGATLTVKPVRAMEISFPAKYVGKQYLDNTQNEARRLSAFYQQDARVRYTISKRLFREWSIIAQVNNIFNNYYEPNGYTYSYLFDGEITASNYYFPMAGTNFLVALNISL